MNSLLITSRRNFLIRATGFTAAGAAVGVPVVALESPEQRIKHHLEGLQRAFSEFYAPAPVRVTNNEIPPEWVLDPARNSIACIMLMAGAVK